MLEDRQACTKCGSIFRRYFGTTLVKGRSHCRVCCAAVCATCHMVVQNRFKICTRCHIRQKEEEIDTQKALTAIDHAKSGRSDSSTSQISSEYVFINVAASVSLTPEQRKEALFESAKKGDHYAMITLLNAKADVNTKDASRNTPLFYAAEGGHLPCVALLMERGASVTVVNDAGWTPLHALAWKGATDEHVECAEQLIQMGADVFALTSTQETAADLADRCGGKPELVKLLQAAEVDVAIKHLQRMIRKSSEHTHAHTLFSTVDIICFPLRP
ncbi:predicted protein [Nematostella vectensis]|uniref:Uncharacterized protein n=1 Tax=Nematostella vectensis TaxID=45351 RepID=A7SC52_NEMVE|nr:predicted protein [Nematostella vectensis]|eukprot:XP_001630763.1 predicted protein [Nematostella vectensis]